MNKLYSRLGILVLLLCCVYPAFSQKWEDWEGDYCSNYTVRYKNNDITGWITYKFNAETHEAYVSDAAPFHTNHLVIPSSVTVEFYNPHNDCKMEYVDCTVIGIGRYACASYEITSLSLPSSVEYIGVDAFVGCTNLSTVNGCKAKVIDSNAFGRTGITTLNFLGNVSTLGDRCFQQCQNLTSAVLPGSISSIGQNIFYECKNLSSVTICQGISTITENMFRCCSSLESINIPSSVTSIKQFAFAESGLKSIEIPNTVVDYSNSALYGCEQLEYVYINVTSLDGYPYTTSSPVKKLVLGDLVESLKVSYGYNQCLEELVIGRSVKELGGSVFSSMDSGAFIEKVTCKAIEPPTIIDRCFNEDTYKKARLIVPRQSLSKYQSATGWKKFMYIEENSPDAIPGDVNGGSDVNTDDIIAVCDFITGNPGPVTKENADVNGDGQVDVGDIIAVTNIITGN